MNIKKLLITIGVASVMLPMVSHAAPVVYNLALPNISTFDNTITGTGSTVQVVQVVNGSAVYNYLDTFNVAQTLTVTRMNGSAAVAGGGYTSGSHSLSGAVYNINPTNNGTDPIPGQSSGLHFAFSSAVNAFGFEIGDWATCCTGSGPRPTPGVPAYGSGLWIAFNGGAATLPANALSANDNPGVALDGSFTNFIGAIDSSGTFNSLDFWGDGFGEFLVAGGSFRFASVPIGSVGVPEPASLALFGLGAASLALLRRRKEGEDA